MTSFGSGDNSDPFMRELFAAEVEMHLPVLSEGLLALEKGRAGKEEIDSMMRAAHSIKGAARVVGIDRAVRVAHVMEDCFTAAKQGRITLTSDAVDTLLQGVDILQRICAQTPDAELSEHVIESLLTRIAAESDPTKVSLAPSQAAERCVVLPEVLDDATAASLRAELWQAIERGSQRIMLDGGRVERVTALQLALLVSFAREVESLAPAPSVVVRRVAAPVQSLLRIAGIEFPVVPDPA